MADIFAAVRAPVKKKEAAGRTGKANSPKKKSKRSV